MISHTYKYALILYGDKSYTKKLFNGWNFFQDLLTNDKSVLSYMKYNELKNMVSNLTLSVNKQEYLINMSIFFFFGRKLELLLGSPFMLGSIGLVYGLSILFNYKPLQMKAPISDEYNKNSLAIGYTILSTYYFSKIPKNGLIKYFSFFYLLYLLFNTITIWEIRPAIISSFLIPAFIHFRFRLPNSYLV